MSKSRPNERSLESLLEWAQSINAYIEISSDGSAEVQMGVDYDYRVVGSTIREALYNARRYAGRWPHILAGMT